MNGTSGEGGTGRVTTIELRTAAGAACTRAMAEYVSWREVDPAARPVRVGVDGSVGALGVGVPVAPLEAAWGLVRDDDLGAVDDACGWWVGEARGSGPRPRTAS